jgi:hypothetical protein
LKLGDARLSVAQPVEQPDAHRFAEHAEALGDELDQRLGQWVGNRREFGHVARLAQAHSCVVEELPMTGYCALHH